MLIYFAEIVNFVKIFFLFTSS